MQEDWSITLSILESPYKSLIGRQIVFYRSPISIGQTDNNDMVISDPAVSRNHAILRITDNNTRVYVTDLSTRGTEVSGKVVPKGRGMGVTIENGDIIKLGDSILQYELHTKSGVQSTFNGKTDSDFPPFEMEGESGENIPEMETIDTTESPIKGFSTVSIVIILICLILMVYLILFTK